MTNEAAEAQANVQVEQEPTADISVQQELLPAVIADVFGSLVGPELNNFDGNATDKFRLTALATGPTVQKFDATIGRSISIKYFYVHPVRIDKQGGGEFVNALRCVLIEPNGTAYGFVSDMIAKDLARMVRFFGIRPWDPPVEVQVTKTAGNHGHHFYNLVPAK